MKLSAIFDYANKLTENGFLNLADLIDYINEAQEIIARYDMIMAEPVEYSLDESHEIVLPGDFLQLHKITINDSSFTPMDSPWNGVLTLPTWVTAGTLKLWYYKTPAPLLSTTPDQIPDVGAQYHRAIGSYAAKMYYLVDDDQPLREAFRVEFEDMIKRMKVPMNVSRRYTGY